MRILLYGINYAPELTGIGKYTGELAKWLAKKGHEVMVITAPPYYPQWKVQSNYSNLIYKIEKIDGVRVVRCPLWVPKSPRGLKRIVHLLSFALTSLPAALIAGLFWRPKTVWAVEPPFFCAPTAWLTAKIAGAKSWLHIQDFELDAAFNMGILPKGPLREVALFCERIILNRFDTVSTISDNMLKKLTGKGVEESRSVLFPNWVDVEIIKPLEDREGVENLKKNLGIGNDKVVALYSGNMGAKQGLEILVDSAKDLRGEDIVFLICGEGGVRRDLESQADGMDNVIFAPLQPFDRLNELLNLADIHLLPQRADVADLVMPSKLTGMLASGRPVVATVEEGTEVFSVVSKCGVVVPPGDSKEMAEAIKKLALSNDERDRLGTLAREFAVESLGSEAILKDFESLLI